MSTLIFDLICLSDYWNCFSSFGIPVFSNMVSEPVWRPAPVVDRDREAELPHLHFLAFMYISGLKGLFHCVRSTLFIQEHFSFHSKRFLFAQDTAITVRIRRYKVWIRIFKNFCKEVFWFYFGFVFFYFRVATLLDLCMLFSPCPVR